jgi:hypothetical protein
MLARFVGVLFSLYLVQCLTFRAIRVRNSGKSALFMSDELPPRTFASYIIYKGKGAASLKSVPPSFKRLGDSNSRTVDRLGGLLFEIAPSTGNPREYDWQKKGTFLLDPTECGELISMERSVGCEFFHDPNMADSSKAGMVTKKMKWMPSNDGRGVFLSLQVTSKGQEAGSMNYSVPVTWAELEVIRSILTYSIPYYLGFDKVWSNPPLGTAGDATPPNPEAPLWAKLE